MKKKILILGASAYQVPAIKRAISLGYEVATTDNVPQNPGHALAGESFQVDATDAEGVVSLAKAIKADGVLSPATDAGVVAAAEAAARLGLPGVPADAAATLTDKIRFRSFLSANELPCPRFWAFSGPAWPASPLGAPRPPGEGEGSQYVVKPNRSSGSKGAFIVENMEDFGGYAPEALGFSLDKTAILEEFLPGRQGTAEGVLEGGRAKAIMLTDRLTAPKPYVATWGHLAPGEFGQEGESAIVCAIERVFKLLSVTDCVFDCDFVAAGAGEVYLLELTPRLGGNSLTALCSASLGLDLADYAVRLACGDFAPCVPKLKPTPAAIILLGVLSPGRAAWDRKEERALRKEKWVSRLTFDVSPGTKVEPFINGRRRLGEALIEANGRDGLREKIQELRRRLRLRAE
jgi:biotin carboxylase